MIEIYPADHPLVLDGTYDTFGWKPGERERIAKARARQSKGSEPMAKKAKSKSAKQTQAKRGRPRQPDLPGTEDRAIKPLEDLAAAYADARDRRMELTKEEHELKAHALKLMKKYDKTIYRHDGIEIRVIPGEEDVKVKVRKAGEDDEADDGDQVEIGDTAAEEATD